MTMMAKRNKEKQLAQLTQRLQATRDKIASVLLLFFRECVKCMQTLLDEEGKQKEKEEGKDGQSKEKEEEENKEDEDAMEMDDDLLMSEQFIHKQEKRDKEKEQMALRKSRESN